MRIYPAIDLKGGRCVRLRQGDPNQETVFSDDPAAQARHWVQQGAEWIHVVDLDGALSGSPQNAAAITAIVDAVSVPVQLGGGMRELERIRAALDRGVRRVIVGTRALEDPNFVRHACREFPGAIAVGIDARDGYVATRGWGNVTGTLAADLAARVADDGVCAIIYTDIATDGMLQGPNLAATEQLARAVPVPIIASGGVSSLEDIRALRALSEVGVEGAIVGRALYDGKLSLSEAIAVARG